MRWRALAILLTIASAVAVYVGVYAGLRSLYRTRDSIYRELAFADLDVHFVPEDVNNLPSLHGVEGVEVTERRLVFPGVLQEPGGEKLSAQLIFLENPRPRLNRFRFLEGRPFREDAFDEVVIEQALARYHGYRVGDEIDVKVGEKVYKGRIVGIVLSPEFLVATSNPDYYVPEKGSLGIVYANIERLSDTLGFTLVNDLLFGYRPGSDPEAVKRAVLARIDKLQVDQVVTRRRQFGYVFVQTNLAAISNFVPTMVVLLLVLVSVITSINFSRLIAIERREIGALLAIGYSRGALVRSYLEGALVLGVLGGTLGLGLSYVVRDVFSEICASSMGMPVVRTWSFPAIMARGFVYGLVVTAASALLPVLRLLRLPLNEILREIHRLSDGRFRGGLSMLPSSYRYAIRNLLRQRGRAWATAASIALALGVASAYRISARSIDETLTRRFENDRWNLAVGFLYPVYRDEAEELQETPGVQSMTPYLRHYVELEHEGKYADAVVFGVDPEERMSSPPILEGGDARGENEILISWGLARDLGVSAGDVVKVSVRSEVHSFVVTGVTTDAVTDLATMPLSAAQGLFDLPDKVTGAQFRVRGSDAAVESALLESEFVGKVFRKTQFLAQMRNVLEVMIRVLDLAAVINIVVGILFVLTAINLSVLETEGEFATLKAIGYGDGAVGRIVITETVALALGAAVLSIPLGELTSIYLNDTLAEVWFRVDNFFLPMEFARVLLPALLFIPLGVYPGLRHVVRLDVSGVLRTRAIE